MPYRIRKKKREEGGKGEEGIWIYGEEGITSKYYPMFIKAITDVMMHHTWEQTWRELSDHMKHAMSNRFLELVGGHPEFSVTSDRENSYFHDFEVTYMEMRKTERKSQWKKIFIDEQRFLEMERKVEMLWYAPGMPGCMEEINQAANSFLSSSPLRGLASES